MLNTSGFNHIASGVSALRNNTTGLSNIAIGVSAGQNLTTGNNNIDIGNTGVAAESATIRLGTAGTHTKAFIAGIRGVTTGSVTGIPVLIDINGQLGTTSSSRRFKDNIADMAESSSELMKLRPVTFHYKTDQDPAGRTLQYGLIAEEVAAVNPGLVVRSADGQIETVLYQFLPPMLLNESQKQQRTIQAQAAQIAHQTGRIAELTQQMARLAELEQQVARLSAFVQPLRRADVASR